MKCALCSQASEYICPCNYIQLCQTHATSHCILRGLHHCECLNISKTDLENQGLNEKVLIRITEIENLKQTIISYSNNLKIKIAKYSKLSLQKLDRLSQLYCTLVHSKFLSSSLKIEAENVLSTSLKVKEIKLELDSVLQEAFTRNLISFVKIVQTPTPEEKEEESESSNIFTTYERTRLQRKSTFNECSHDQKKYMETQRKSMDENRRKIENEVNRTVQARSQIFSKDTLENRLAFMSSLGIGQFDLSFGPGKYYRLNIQEIKFSNDKKFCFVCKGYEGNDRQKIGVYFNKAILKV